MLDIKYNTCAYILDCGLEPWYVEYVEGDIMVVFDLLYAFIIGMAIYIVIMQIAEKRVEFTKFNEWNKVTLQSPHPERFVQSTIVDTALKLDLIVLKLEEGVAILKEKPSLVRLGMVYAVERDNAKKELNIYYHNTLWGNGSIGRARSLAHALFNA